MKTQVLSPEAVDAAAEEVRQLTGLVFQPSRRADFAGALQHAMRRAGERDTGRYLERVRREHAVHDELIAEITVGETYFFRDPKQLGVVRDLVFATLPRNRKLRLWSAGCASGEEPYTLAMMVREDGREPAVVVGTDLSRAALARAQRAQYTKWSLRGVSEEAIQTHFETDDRHVRPIRAVREMVELRYLNLAEDHYPSLANGIWHMDLILCRNVLIYLDQETVTRVATRLLESLSPDGWLFLGGADPLLGNLVACDVVTTDSGLAYRRHDPQRAPMTERRAAPLHLTPVPLPVEETDWFGSYEPTPPQPAVIEADGSNITILAQIRASANGGDIESASRLCETTLEQERNSAELFYLHAVLLAEGGHHEAAAQAARRALYLDRDLAVAYVALGGSLARLGDRSGSRVALTNAQRLLDAMPEESIVPASDGEQAGRLAAMTRMQLRLSETSA